MIRWTWATATLILLTYAAGSGSWADTGGVTRAAVDLLRLIDLKNDAYGGTWAFEGRALVSPSLPFGRLQVPYVPPAEYDLRATVQAKEGPNSARLGLVAGGAQVLVVLDGSLTEPTVGLDLIDSRPFYDNMTTRLRIDLGRGRPLHVLCSVRKEFIKVWADGREVIDWKLQPIRLSLWPSWRMARADVLFVGAWKTPVTIHRLDLFPVTGRGRPLR